MRRVFDNDMCAHVWAQQSQPEGRTSNGNMSFQGGTLYSYSTPIAHILPGADGAPVALVTSESYSITTTAHTWCACDAVKHLRRFRVPFLAIQGWRGRYRQNGDTQEAHRDNIAHMLARYASTLAAAKRARDVPYWLRPGAYESDYSLSGIVQEVRRYCEAFALPLPALPDVEADCAAILAHHDTPRKREARERAGAAREAARAQREETTRLRFAALGKRAEAWRAGASVNVSGAVCASGGALLRVRGNMLETSQGARVPLREAVRVFHFVRRCRERGEGWKANGARFHVGHFQLSEVLPSGDFVAGCHSIYWPEVEAAARAAGVLGAPDDESAAPEGGALAHA